MNVTIIGMREAQGIFQTDDGRKIPYHNYYVTVAGIIGQQQGQVYGYQTAEIKIRAASLEETTGCESPEELEKIFPPMSDAEAEFDMRGNLIALTKKK